jgi:hypothetical protein
LGLVKNPDNDGCGWGVYSSGTSLQRALGSGPDFVCGYLVVMGMGSGDSRLGSSRLLGDWLAFAVGLVG